MGGSDQANSYETLTDSHSPLFRGVATWETLSVSGSKQRLSSNSNELACITIQDSAENFIDVRSMVHQMMSTSNTNILYQLFTTNCRWFVRHGFLNTLQSQHGDNSISAKNTS
jgi:hypothetical protein